MPTFRAAMQAVGISSVPSSMPTVRAFTTIGITETDQNFTISGTTLDSNGAAKASATVYLFEMRLDANGVKQPVYVMSTVSDGSGLFSFVVSGALQYWITDYKSGTQDLAGATLQTLTGE